MGLAIARLLDVFGGKEERRLLLLGLDAAGKTTLLYRLKLGSEIRSIPTIGFNAETVEYKNVSFQAWDVGGQDKIRRLWHHYFKDTDALMYVVDSADRERLDEAKTELDKLLATEELRDAKLLVFANKQDLPHALTPAQVADHLELRKITGRDWFVQGSTASIGDGLYEGLDWVVSSLKKRADA